MSDSPSLLELQQWLRRVLTEPRGMSAALDGPCQNTRPDALSWISSTKELDAEARLNIYAEGYFTRLSDALANTFPALSAVMGEAAFNRLVAHYLVAHPSTFANIEEVGGQLSNYLSGTPWAQQQPWLPDLAALEWAILLSFHDEESPPLDLRQLQTISESAWAQARLRLAPSIRLLHSEWAIDFLWQARQTPPTLEPSPCQLMVCRRPDGQQVERVSLLEFRTLQGIQEGQPLGAIFATVSQELEASHPSPQFRNGLRAGRPVGLSVVST